MQITDIALECDLCHRRFPKACKLQRHINETHLDLKAYECLECRKTFKREHHLKRHQLTHSGDKPWSCPVAGCPMAFSCKHHVKRHFQIIHQKLNSFNCTECEFMTHKKKQIKIYIPKRLLNQHKLQCQKGEKPHRVPCKDSDVFVCKVDDCTRYYKRQRMLQEHMRKHHNTQETPNALICEVCAKAFNHKSSLLRHIQQQHKTESNEYEVMKFADEEHETEVYQETQS